MINIIITKDRLVAETEFALLIELDSNNSFWIPKRYAKLIKNKQVILNVPESFEIKTTNNNHISTDQLINFLKD